MAFGKMAAHLRIFSQLLDVHIGHCAEPHRRPSHAHRRMAGIEREPATKWIVLKFREEIRGNGTWHF
jgi:hypothetical protein